MVKAMKKVLVGIMAAALTLGVTANAGAATASPNTSVKAVTASNVKASNGSKVNTNKNGTATVTAKCGDLSAQTKVTVINPLKAITITVWHLMQRNLVSIVPRVSTVTIF